MRFVASKTADRRLPRDRDRPSRPIGASTNTGAFAADLLQVQPSATIDSIHDCSHGEPASPPGRRLPGRKNRYTARPTRGMPEDGYRKVAQHGPLSGSLRSSGRSDCFVPPKRLPRRAAVRDSPRFGAPSTKGSDRRHRRNASHRPVLGYDHRVKFGRVIGKRRCISTRRLWQLTRGLRGWIALAILLGLVASVVGIARFAILGVLLSRVFNGAGFWRRCDPGGGVAIAVLLRGFVDHHRDDDLPPHRHPGAGGFARPSL